MRQSLLLAGKAMDVAQQRMGLITNNLANIDTPGYKKEIAYTDSFQDIMASTINGLQSPEIPKDVVEVTDYSSGNYKFTGDQMNVAIEGDGFLKVQTPNGQDAYTRKGLLSLNASKQLTIGNNLVMGPNGPVTLLDTNISIDSKGTIYNTKGDTVGMISVVAFEKPYPLEKAGGTLFIANENAKEIPSTADVKQQYLEESNVSALSSMVEMINMMEVMRQYETQQKMVQYQDDATAKMIQQVAG